MAASVANQAAVPKASNLLTDGADQPAPTEYANGSIHPAGESAEPTKLQDQQDPSLNNSKTTESELDNGVAADAAKAPGVVKTPFVEPLPESQCDPPPQLTAEQEAKYQDLLSTVRSWTTIPNTSGKNSPTAPLTDDERLWLTRECLLRYLRAVKWSAVEAPKRLRGTLTWRREYGVAKHTADYISPENETGKQVLLGYDVKARPCLYLIPSRQNTKRTDRQVQHLVFMLERVIDLMVPGQDSLSLFINYKDSSSGEVPSVSQGREVLSILQTHYPERLGRAYVINLPWYVNGFFKLISPFIDPLTREKLRFNEDLRPHVPPAQLLSTMGGQVEFAYDHATYWPALTKLAEGRRKAQEERWIRGGKKIGESEIYLRGGEANSIAETEDTSTTPDATVANDDKGGSSGV
ncbi:MAG: hypothetical protein M1837_003355 [Sclerophora amabilis]|nr:MAG: hypothetical protein M1837_003355 [Sclerophora amabilis]